MTRDIIQLRNEITIIDEKLLMLLGDRMKLSILVALYKKEHKLPIFDPKREEEMLLAYDEKVDFEVREIFLAIIKESKRIQTGVIS